MRIEPGTGGQVGGGVRRDMGVARLRRVTGSVVVGAVALIGALSASVAAAVPGRSGHSPSAGASGSAQASTPGTTALQPPAQAPSAGAASPTTTPTTAPPTTAPPVVSGGS